MQAKSHAAGHLRTALALLLAGSLLLAAGCGQTEDPQEEANTDPAAGFPRTVDHAMGSTTIPAAPKRIIALDQTFVDAAFSLDTPIVGFTELGSSGSRLPDYLGEANRRFGKEAVSVGTLAEPSLELIAQLKPDLILSAKIRHEEIYDRLTQIAPTVFSETTGPTWKQNVALLGLATGQEELADERIGSYEERARMIGDAIRDKLGRNPTVSVVRFVGETRLYQKASFSGIVLADTGLARPPSQDVDDFALAISEEQIPEADADYIFTGTYDIDEAHEDENRFKTNPLWERLQGEIHVIDDEVWGTAVGLQGAQAMLDDLARIFEVDDSR